MTNRLAICLQDVTTHLKILGCRWCLVGGLAVSARSEPRFTRDVDIAILVTDDAEAEVIIRHFHQLGWQSLAVLEQQATGRLATVRFLPPGSQGARVVVDLLFSSSGIEPETVLAATDIEVFPDLFVSIACTPHLLAMKVLASNERDRPQDIADIQSLLQVASDSDLNLTRALLRLIASRGANRGKQLETEFDTYLQRFLY